MSSSSPKNRSPPQSVDSDETLPSPPVVPKQQWTFYLIFCNVSIIMGSSFMFGYNAGVINAPFAVINTYINESFTKQDKILSKDELSAIWSLVVSLHLLGGMAGSIWFPSALASLIGRRDAMIVAALIGALGASCSFITPFTGSYIPLMIGRPVVGFATGLSMVNAPGLINEQAPARIRGALGSLFVLGSPIGAMISNMLGLTHILGRPNTWQYLFLFVAAVYVINGICLVFVVESPRYLIIKNRELEAVKALMKLRNGTESDISAEFVKAKFDIEHEPGVTRISPVEVFKDRRLWWPMVLVINLQISCQLTGLGAAYYYATKVMKDAGLDGESAAFANFGISFGTIFGNCINIVFVDRVGRRLLMLVGLALVVLANVMLVVTITFKLLEACIVGFLLFLICYVLGPGPIGMFMSAELTTPVAKPTALALGMFVNWSGKLVTGLLFPVMQLHIGAYSFLPFAAVAFLEFVFHLLFLPETSAQLVDFNPNQFASGQSLLQTKWRQKEQTRRESCSSNTAFVMEL